MIPEMRDHSLSLLSSDSLLPPSLLELSRLLQRPTLDLVLLDDGSSHVCSYGGFVYSGPMLFLHNLEPQMGQRILGFSFGDGPGISYIFSPDSGP